MRARWLQAGTPGATALGARHLTLGMSPKFS